MKPSVSFTVPVHKMSPKACRKAKESETNSSAFFQTAPKPHTLINLSSYY